MKVIHKQKIPHTILNNSETLELPIGAEILNIMVQDTAIVIWYEFDIVNLKKLTSRDIYCVGIGIAFDIIHDYKYISTLQIKAYVYHFYERVY